MFFAYRFSAAGTDGHAVRAKVIAAYRTGIGVGQVSEPLAAANAVVGASLAGNGVIGGHNNRFHQRLAGRA